MENVMAITPVDILGSPVAGQLSGVKQGTGLFIDTDGTISIATNGIINTNISTTAAIDSGKLSYTSAGTGSSPRTVYSKLGDIISVKDFGAVGDGVTDDANAIQNAVNYANSINGGVIFFPAGIYKVNSTITLLRGGITLLGVGWEDYVGAQDSHPTEIGHGSWIYWDNTSISPFVLNALPYGNTTPDQPNMPAFVGLAFAQNQPAPAPGWTPTVYPPAIVAITPVSLERVMFFGLYRGIQFGEPSFPETHAAAGRLRVDFLHSECFDYTIDIQFAADVPMLSRVHIWPFWSLGPNVSYVTNYRLRNTYGIKSARNDNPIFSDIFMIGVWKGLYLYRNANGGTSKMKVTNLDIDISTYGIYIEGNDHGLHVCNFTSQGLGTDSAGLDNVGVFLNGDGCTVQLTNVDLAQWGRELVKSTGNSTISIVNGRFINWNIQNGGYTGISVPGGTQVYLSGSLQKSGGNGTSLIGSNIANYTCPSILHSHFTTTTNGTGRVTVNHNQNIEFTTILATPQTTVPVTICVDSYTPNQVVFRFYNSSGTALANTAISFYYQLGL